MKEAAGEANLTVIAIVLIGIVAAVATPLITRMMNTTKLKSCCLQAGCEWFRNACTIPSGVNAQYCDYMAYKDCALEG